MRTSLLGFVFAGWMAVGGWALAQEVPSEPPRLLPKPRPALPAQPGSGEHLVRLTAAADVAQIVPGQKFHLAFVFDIEPQWHIYWKNPGDAGGGPTDIRVAGPADYEIGATLFPRPITIVSEEGTSYGYENKAVLYVEVTPPPQTTVSQVTFNAKVNWMVCKDVCLLGRSSQMITLPVGEAPLRRPVSPATSDPAVAQFKSRLPKPLKELGGAEAKVNGNTLTIKAPAQNYSSVEFFPVETPGVEFEDATISAEENWIIITVPLRLNANNAMGGPMKVIGVLGMGTRQTDPCYEIDIALPAT